MVTFQRSPAIVCKSVQDEYIVVDASNNSCHVLNSTAGWLLEICAEPVSLDEAIQKAQELYDLPAGSDIKQELMNCLLVMQAKGLMILTS